MYQQIICGILTGQIVLRCGHGKDLFNLREKRLKRVLSFSFQVTKCGGLPNNILDVWEFLGKPKHCQYTWDTQMNSNLGIAATCKLRFDRIFFRAAAEGGHIIPQSLDLLGLEKLDCGRFPSDHWGLLCNLDIILLTAFQILVLNV